MDWINFSLDVQQDDLAEGFLEVLEHLNVAA